MTQLMEVPFAVWTLVGPSNHVLGGDGSRSPIGREICSCGYVLQRYQPQQQPVNRPTQLI